MSVNTRDKKDTALAVRRIARVVYTQTEYRNTMNDCADDPNNRDCSSCIAHPNNGGPCCFGDIDEYDEEDEACKGCPHHDDCRKEVFDKSTAVSSRYSGRLVQIGTRTTKPSITGSRFTTRPTYTPPQKKSSPLLKGSPATDLRKTDMKPIEHFFLVCAWGLLEGLFQSAAQYFEANRPTKRRR